MIDKELNEFGVYPMSHSEIKAIEGGILVGLWGITREVTGFIVGEVVDFGKGVYDGFTYFVK